MGSVEIKLTLPKELYKKVLEKSREAGFSDINEFIVFVLEQLITEEPGAEMSAEDEEKVKERLRALGYIE